MLKSHGGLSGKGFTPDGQTTTVISQLPYEGRCHGFSGGWVKAYGVQRDWPEKAYLDSRRLVLVRTRWLVRVQTRPRLDEPGRLALPSDASSYGPPLPAVDFSTGNTHTRASSSTGKAPASNPTPPSSRSCCHSRHFVVKELDPFTLDR